MITEFIRRGAVGTAVLAISLCGVVVASPAQAAAPTTSCTAKTLLAGTSIGASGADDIAIVDQNIFVGFQNGVGSRGEASTSGGTKSTLVELNAAGTVVNKWLVTGKIDGLGADPANKRVIGTVNEDGNSALFTAPAAGGALSTYHYTPAHAVPAKGTSPAYTALVHGGGTDAISVFHGHILISASAPTASAGVPAVFQVTLSGTTATVAASGIAVDSSANVINSPGTKTRLALTDPDSNTTVPAGVPNVGGDFVLDAQGDGQLVFASQLPPTSAAPLKVLDLTPGGQVTSVDDTTFPTGASGVLISTSGSTVSAITCPFALGMAYSAVTPGNANNAPAAPAPNYLATLNLANGTLTPALVDGAKFSVKGLAFLARTTPGTSNTTTTAAPNSGAQSTAAAASPSGVLAKTGPAANPWTLAGIAAALLIGGGLLMRRGRATRGRAHD